MLNLQESIKLLKTITHDTLIPIYDSSKKCFFFHLVDCSTVSHTAFPTATVTSIPQHVKKLFSIKHRLRQNRELERI
jgi:hypothetical protein